MKLSTAQARVLLYRFNAGNFGWHTWATIESLLRLGLLARSDNRIVVTEAGRQWCFENHLNY